MINGRLVKRKRHKMVKKIIWKKKSREDRIGSNLDPTSNTIILRSGSFFIPKIVGSYDPMIKIAILTTMIVTINEKIVIKKLVG